MRRPVLPTLPVVLNAMQAAERAARMWPDKSRRRSLGSITWGTRARTLGATMPADDTFNILPFPALMSTAPPVPIAVSINTGGFIQNPDTRPGAWPGLNQPAVITANGAPQQVPMAPAPAASNAPVPVVVTPTSGPIPAPQTVAAATAPVSWLDQELIAGVQNKYLLLGGIAAAIFLGGRK